MRQLAGEKGVTPAQLSLAWLLHQGQEVVPIPGTSDLCHVEENAAAVGVRLDAAELARIDAMVPQPAGARYDPEGMRTVGI